MAILKPGQLASGSYTISGSFSGSFQGSGAGLNNIPSSAVVGLSSSLNIGTTPIASGTVGRVLFEGTGNVLQQSGNLFWDGTNERLGIGTSTPSSQIDVFASNPIISTRIATDGIGKFNYLNGAGTAEFAGIYLNANSGEMRMFANTSYFPTFYSSNAEIMRIPTTGNVLINTITDAGFKLDVNGTARVVTSLTTPTVFATGGPLSLYGGFNNRGRIDLFNNTTGLAIDFQGNGSSRMQLYSNGNLLIGTTTDTGHKLTVSGSGASGSVNLDNTLYVSGSNVGIGTSSPSTRLHVIGSEYTFAATSGGINFYNTPGVNSHFNFTNVRQDSDYTFRQNRNGAVNTTSLILKGNTGNVLINTTTDAGFRLDVNGTARVKGTGATSSTTAFTVQNTNASSSMVVLDNGNVGIGTSSPTQLLDISEALNWVRSNGSNLEIGRSAGQSARVSLTRDIVGAGGAIVFTEGNATATTGTAISQNGNSNLVFLTSNGTALTERLRIGSTGNTLINTTTDAGYKLDVNGTANVSSTLTTANVRSNSDLAHDVGSVGIRYNAVYTRLIGSGNSVFSIFNNTGTSIHIPSTNNILIGTTTDANYKLLISGSGISGSLNVDNTLYVTGSRVGIGTSTPAYQFNIENANQSLYSTNIGAYVDLVNKTKSSGGRSSLTVLNDTNIDLVSAIYSSAETGTFMGENRANRAYIYTSNASSLGILTVNNTPLQFGTNNTERIRITISTGNVLIGTTTDAGYKLDVNGTARVQGNAQISSIYLGTSNNVRLEDLSGVMDLKGYSGFSLKTWAAGWGSGNAALTVSPTGYIGIGQATPSASLHISGASSATLLEIDSPAVNNILFVTGSGRVGIGTGTPTETLDISGSAIVRSTLTATSVNSNSVGLVSSNQLMQPQGGSGEFRFTNGAGNGWYYTWLQNGASPVERMRLSTSNNLLIGTTTDAGYRLDVNGTARVSGNFTSNTLLGTGTMTIAQGNYTINFDATGKTPIIFDLAGASNQTLTVNSSGVNALTLNISGTTTATGKIQTATALVAGLDATTSGWTSSPIRPGQPLGNANNAVGSNLIVQGGQGTGTGIGGDILFQLKSADGGGSQVLSTLSTFVTMKQMTGYVGIGTSSPSASLHISGASSTALLEIDSPAVNNILYVSGSGNVGIRTSTPAYTLDVYGSPRFYGDGNHMYTRVFSGASNKDSKILFGNDSERFNVGLAASSNTFAINSSNGGTPTSINIDYTTGNVLIGTTTDAGYKLDVNGTARVKGTGTSGADAFTVQDNTGVQIFNVNDLGQIQIGKTTAINWTFSSNSLISTQYAFIFSNNGSILTTGAASGGVFGNNNGGKISDNGIANAQVASAVLEVNSTTKGFLPPRMTGAQAEAISSPAEGLMVYATDGTGVTITSKGWWGYDGATWVKFN